MILAPLRGYLSLGWILALTLVASRSEGQPGIAAVVNSASVDSIKQQISQLVRKREYGQVALSYDYLGQLYHQQYGYNKYSLDA